MLKLPAPPRRTILGLIIIALAILGWGVFRGLDLIVASSQGKSVLISRGVMFYYDSEITINDHNFTIKGPPELSFLQEVGLSPAPIAAVDTRGFKLSSEEWKRVCKIPSLQVLLVHGSNIQFVDLQHLRARSRFEILGVSGTSLTDEELLTLISSHRIDIVSCDVEIGTRVAERIPPNRTRLLMLWGASGPDAVTENGVRLIYRD